MDLREIKKVNLRDYARQRWGLVCNSSGMALCPFHPDKKPSLSIFQTKSGSWRFKCFGCGKSGSIIDLKMFYEGRSQKEAIAELSKELQGPIEKADPKIQAPAAKKAAPDPSAKKAAAKETRNLEDAKLALPFDYKDEAGKVVYRKIKYIYEDGEKEYKFRSPVPDKPGEWDWTKGKGDFIPYNLDKFKGNTEIIICEGEKDANTITRLKGAPLATSAPTGESTWDNALTPHFKNFKKTYFLYDVGNDKSVQGHAQKLQTAFPKMEIFIVKIPLEKREADITDYLSTFKDPERKQKALRGLLDKSEKFMADEIEGRRPHAAQADLEKIVLARLIQRPESLALEGLEAALFSPGPLRRIFRTIEKLAKNDEKIDEILVSKEAGIKASEALEIIGGTDQIPVENFKDHVQKLREAARHKDLFVEIEKQKAAFTKGAPPDFATLGKILGRIEDGKTEKEKPRAETLTEFLKRDLPKRQTLIEPVLALQEITMIHGRPKIGKSLLSLQLARCIIAEKDWLGLTTHKLDRPILILQVESSLSLYQERLQILFGDIAEPKITDSNIMITDKIIVPLQCRNVFLNEQAGTDQILCYLDEFNPGLVFLDPYKKFFTDGDAALKDPGPFFDFWREQVETRNLSLFFIHHDAKFQEGKLGGLKSLGTTEIAASTDGNWNLERILDAGLDPVEFIRTARLSFESRNWEHMRPLDLRLNENLTFETVVLQKGSVDEWDLVEEIEKAGGQIELKELLGKFKSTKMFYVAKNRALSNDLIDEIKLNTRGNPSMLMLKKGDTGSKGE